MIKFQAFSKELMYLELFIIMHAVFCEPEISNYQN